MAMNVSGPCHSRRLLIRQQPSPTPSHGHSRFGQEDQTSRRSAQTFAAPAAAPDAAVGNDTDMQAEPSMELNLDDDVEDMDASGFTDD